mmetsp:Transcript_2672/g.6678  ORF Transcript_2672/g.6678 Transcript_2672/m.6678 type:complete len:303 (-) Transcript_2672:516-1424(-)
MGGEVRREQPCDLCGRPHAEAHPQAEADERGGLPQVLGPLRRSQADGVPRPRPLLGPHRGAQEDVRAHARPPHQEIQRCVQDLLSHDLSVCLPGGRVWHRSSQGCGGGAGGERRLPTARSPHRPDSLRRQRCSVRRGVGGRGGQMRLRRRRARVRARQGHREPQGGAAVRGAGARAQLVQGGHLVPSGDPRAGVRQEQRHLPLRGRADAWRGAQGEVAGGGVYASGGRVRRRGARARQEGAGRGPAAAQAGEEASRRGGAVLRAQGRRAAAGGTAPVCVVRRDHALRLGGGGRATSVRGHHW